MKSWRQSALVSKDVNNDFLINSDKDFPIPGEDATSTRQSPEWKMDAGNLFSSLMTKFTAKRVMESSQ